jgi:8-amino-7-oxononanoate synthase
VDIETWLGQTLAQRKSKNLFRELKISSDLKDFCSNDYLGLASNQQLFSNITERIESLNLKQNGATGSRLLSGNSAHAEQLEHKLAAIFNGESALIFNSGYTANMAVLSSIPQKGDTIIYDELAHACIKDGARLSLAKRFSFKHNDLNDLEQKIKRSEGKIFIAVESIYSMDGDECLLSSIALLAQQYNASIILDEAHSTGVTGSNGSGYAVSLGLHKKIAIRIYTFGKAMGCHGACVVGSSNLTQYLINFARPFIYTTALSPHSIVTIECAFDFLAQHVELQSELRKKIDLYNTCNRANAVKSNTSIQTVLIPGNHEVKHAALELQEKGFDIRPILSPTVPEGYERLRICLHAFNSDDDIKELVKILTSLVTS